MDPQVVMASTELVVAVECSAPSNVWQKVHGPQFTVRIENALRVVLIHPAGSWFFPCTLPARVVEYCGCADVAKC